MELMEKGIPEGWVQMGLPGKVARPAEGRQLKELELGNQMDWSRSWADRRGQSAGQYLKT